MAETNKIKTEIIQIIATTLKKNPESIQDSNTLQDLGADSLDLVEVIMNIEEHFMIHIDDEQAEQLKSIADVVHYVDQLVKQR